MTTDEIRHQLQATRAVLTDDLRRIDRAIAVLTPAPRAGRGRVVPINGRKRGPGRPRKAA